MEGTYTNQKADTLTLKDLEETFKLFQQKIVSPFHFLEAVSCSPEGLKEIKNNILEKKKTESKLFDGYIGSCYGIPVFVNKFQKVKYHFVWNENKFGLRPNQEV